MAYLFDGTNDKIDHGAAASINSAANLTVMCWVNPVAVAARKGFVSKGSSNCSFCMMFGESGTETDLRVYYSGNPAQGCKASGVFTNGTWTHVAMCYDGAGGTDAQKMQLYMNGVAQSVTFTTSPPATLQSTTGGLLTGSDAFNTTFSNTNVAHLKVWTATLTAAEVASEVWTVVPQKIPNLYVWAPYLESGVAALDYSGQGNNGTITEATIATGPPGVSFGNGVIHPTRMRRSSRRANMDAFRRLGPHVPFYRRGV